MSALSCVFILLPSEVSVFHKPIMFLLALRIVIYTRVCIIMSGVFLCVALSIRYSPAAIILHLLLNNESMS